MASLLGLATIKILLSDERADRYSGVESGGLNLEVQDQSIVDEFLDVEGDLGTIDGCIAGESYFDGNVDAFVVVRMDVEVEGGRQESSGVQEKI
jgi:hypothetical protein